MRRPASRDVSGQPAGCHSQHGPRKRSRLRGTRERDGRRSMADTVGCPEHSLPLAQFIHTESYDDFIFVFWACAFVYLAERRGDSVHRERERSERVNINNRCM